MNVLHTTTPRLRRRTMLAAWLSLLVIGLLLAMPATAKKKKKGRSADDLFNPLLGIEYAHWLVGPIAAMASDVEIDAFLALGDDEAAAQFIADFWAERNADAPLFQATPEQQFHRRRREADKRFSEAAYPGGRTDRGTVWILYGEPQSIEYESPERRGDPTLEVWTYAKDAELGLDGNKPKRLYRFVKLGDLTRLFHEGMRRDPRLRTDPRRGLPRGH